MSHTDTLSQVIGEGAYGCVHKPPMKCINKTRKNKSYSVSKLMTDSNAKSEMREYKLIGSADKYNHFYLGKPAICKVDKVQNNIQAMSQCSGKFDPNMLGNYSLLLMKYGGQDLEQFGNEVYKWTNTKDNVDKIELFWLECIRLFYGLKVFHDNGIVHHDLKHQNIVYDQKTNRINFIDFGFMTKKSLIINLTRRSKYWLGETNHWSFPLENVFWNKNDYIKAITNVKSDPTTTFTSFSNNIIERCEKFFTSILPVNLSTPNRGTLIKQTILASFENVIEAKKEEYDSFINKSVDTIDSYGIGIALMYVLNRSKHLLPNGFTTKLHDLFMNDMLNPKVFIRLTPEQLLANYEEILINSGFLKKHGLNIENHDIITNKMSNTSNIIDEIKETAITKINFTPEIISKSNLEIIRPCTPSKEFNPLTKRCINACKPPYIRNPDFKCVLNIPQTKRKNKVKRKKHGVGRTIRKKCSQTTGRIQHRTHRNNRGVKCKK